MSTAEIALRAERRFGELTEELPKDRGGRPAKKTGRNVGPVSEKPQPPTLAEQGMDKREANRCVKLAATRWGGKKTTNALSSVRRVPPLMLLTGMVRIA